MLGHAEHLHLDVIGTVEDRLGTRRFRQREERALHQIALVARTGVTADHHEGIEAGPLALARRAPPFLLNTERHLARAPRSAAVNRRAGKTRCAVWSVVDLRAPVADHACRSSTA